ncbi:MAG TPA: hypothetical protein VM029_09890 [Opitutaceae bacterium]|nr:hypothetical protein [Opitutaceae bacterium]
MKYPTTRLAFAAASLAALASFSSTSFAQENRKPIVLTPPAVNNGSNASRAPFPAARPFDDVKAPNGEPIDKNVAPNTPATDPEPNALPEPKVAIFQAPRPAGLLNDPGIMPTGRSTVAVATSVDSVTVVPTIRAGMYESRDQVLTDIETRLKNSNTAMSTIRSTSSSMSESGRMQFKAAEGQVKEREKALRKSIKAARKANAQEWDAARTQLAADYEAYASALASVDASAGVR